MSLPAPLTPFDCDLRGMPSMLLDCQRLRDSDLSQSGDAEAFRCAVLSWCAAWHQVPAGSLPDDDRKLAYLLGYGASVRQLRKVREAGGLRGWVKCSDGRLYHPVVCEKANEAYAVKQAQRTRTEAARQAKLAASKVAKKVDQTPPPDDVLDAVFAPDLEQTDSKVQEDFNFSAENVAAEPGQLIVFPTDRVSVTGSKRREGKRIEERKKDPPLRGGDEGSPDVRSRLFRDGLGMLRGMTGLSDRQARSFVGKMLRDVGDRADIALGILTEGSDLRPAEPQAWLIAAVNANRPGRRNAREIDRAWCLDSIVSAEALAAVEAVGL